MLLINDTKNKIKREKSMIKNISNSLDSNTCYIKEFINTIMLYYIYVFIVYYNITNVIIYKVLYV